MTLTLLLALMQGTASARLAGVCLASICIDTGLSERELVRRFGAGSVENAGTTHCYVLPKQGLYFAATADDHSDRDRWISWVYLGRIPWLGCTRSRRAKRVPEPLATGEGLRIGDPQERIGQLYPAWRASNTELSSNGSTVLTFQPDPDDALLETMIEVRAGKVVSILIGAEE